MNQRIEGDKQYLVCKYCKRAFHCSKILLSDPSLIIVLPRQWLTDSELNPQVHCAFNNVYKHSGFFTMAIFATNLLIRFYQSKLKLAHKYTVSKQRMFDTLMESTSEEGRKAILSLITSGISDHPGVIFFWFSPSSCSGQGWVVAPLSTESK